MNGKAAPTQLQEEGQTVSFSSRSTTGRRIIAVADPIKASRPSAIEHLHQLGLKIIMLTGDNERTARSGG